MSNICCLDCRHYLTDCCNNPESENYGLEVDLFDGCEEGECEDDEREVEQLAGQMNITDFPEVLP